MKCLVIALLMLSLLYVCQGYKRKARYVYKYGCRFPDRPLYGTVKFNDHTRDAEYSCEPGFWLSIGLNDVYRRHCDQNGKLSGWNVKCIYPLSNQRRCQELQAPKNSIMIVSGYKTGDTAEFSCKNGYILLGEPVILCGTGYAWTAQVPTCRPYQTVEDYTHLLQEKFIDNFPGSTADSTGALGKLSPGKSGLEIFFVLDTSASVGLENLNLAKMFIVSIVKEFGVAYYTNGTTADGHSNGTRIGLVTFNSNASLIFGLNDESITSVQDVQNKLNTITKTSGGTDYNAALQQIILSTRCRDTEKNPTCKVGTNKAIFFVTDSERNQETERDKEILLGRVDTVKEKGFEIFAIGIGQRIDKVTLSEVASPPFAEHVFTVSSYDDLQKMSDIIAEKNIDYGQCGISGDTSSSTSDAKKGAWPWHGWIGVVQPDDVPGLATSCAGTLLCDKWFMTPAHCVTWVNTTSHTVHTVDTNWVNVHLGDHNFLDANDQNEIVVPVSKIFIHPSYSGIKLPEGVREYDVALLYLGRKNFTRPVLAKSIRPICYSGNDDIVGKNAKLMLSEERSSESSELPGYIAGWRIKSEKQWDYPLPEDSLKQSQTSIRSTSDCQKVFPDLSDTMFFCVGNRIRTETNEHADTGSAYVRNIYALERLVMIGIALSINTIEDDGVPGDFSIYLNVLNPDIASWATGLLRNCSIRVFEGGILTDDEDQAYEDELLMEESEDVMENKNSGVDENESVQEDKEEGEENNETNEEENLGDDDNENSEQERRK
uniref:C3/C5 convertase n=1 Tax=Sinonovacula constricta TaxID=98310 RepID=A0A7U3M7X3_SINCO|nr:complement factor B [Sinonovacula constricta]